MSMTSSSEFIEGLEYGFITMNEKNNDCLMKHALEFGRNGM